MRVLVLVPLLSTSAVTAWELPFSHLWNGVSQETFAAPGVVPTSADTTAPRVAIIGAGAAGSSAAFWISKAKERFGLDIEVDIYERSDYVGGRSTTVHPYNDKSYAPMELGASIFVEANRNMWRASEEFNLTREPFATDSNEQMGIWDGQQFLFTQGTMGGGTFGSWYDTLKVFWRYGINSPRKAKSLVNRLADAFASLYDPEPLQWTSVRTLVDKLNWSEHASQTGLEYFTANGVSARFAHELIGASTRVNYAQDVDEIHAISAAVSLAANGATAVQGGNWRVFDEFVTRSGARLMLNTGVKSVTKQSSGTWSVTSTSGKQDYKAVLLAAPAHNSGLTLPGGPLPEVAYIRLHVTLLATSAPQANASHFGLSPDARVPEMILTARGGNEFNSLSYHGRVLNATTGEAVEPAQWLVKIFSMEQKSDEWLEDVFNKEIHWVLRKEWDSYPVLPPTTVFPPIKLDDGFYYVNAFESLFSTMETETIAARNVVEMMLSDQFDTPGLCPPPSENGTAEQAVDATFVYGWDCL